MITRERSELTSQIYFSDVCFETLLPVSYLIFVKLKVRAGIFGQKFYCWRIEFNAVIKNLTGRKARDLQMEGKEAASVRFFFF